jgi:hypothetical protein
MKEAHYDYKRVVFTMGIKGGEISLPQTPYIKS